MNKLIIILLLFILSSTIILGQTEGDFLFETDSIHTVEITFTQPNWWDTMSYNKEYSDTTIETYYIPATVVIDGTTLNFVGLRFKGNSSYYNNPTLKRSFSLDFDKYISSQTYDGLEKISLNCGIEDPTMVREKIYLDILKKHNLAAPRCSYAKLFINGQYWGLYYLMEKADMGFLQDRFGNNDWNLFRGDNKKTLTEGNFMSNQADLKYRTALEEYYTRYELKTNTTANDWSDLVHLTDIVDNTPPIDFKDSLESILNTNSALGAWAAVNIMSNYDSYWGRWGTNYYVYHNSSTNLFEWITWDASRCLGLGLNWNNPSYYYNMPIGYLQNNFPLHNKMIVVPEYEEVLLDYTCKIVAQDFNPANLFPIIDSLANAIRPHMYADTNKFYSNAEFDANFGFVWTEGYFGAQHRNFGLKEFITQRYNSLQTQISTLGCPSLGIENSVSQENFQFNISPNPTSNNFSIEGLTKPYSLSIYNSLGQILYTENNVLEINKRVDVSKYSKGFLIIRIESEDEVYFHKVLKQ